MAGGTRKTERAKTPPAHAWQRLGCQWSWAEFKHPMQAADPLTLKPIHATVCFFFDLANSIQVDHPQQAGR